MREKPKHKTPSESDRPPRPKPDTPKNEPPQRSYYYDDACGYEDFTSEPDEPDDEKNNDQET